MSNYFARIVALLLTVSLVQEPCLAAFGTVGAGFHPRPQWDDISGRRGSLPLQSQLISEQAIIGRLLTSHFLNFRWRPLKMALTITALTSMLLMVPARTPPRVNAPPSRIPSWTQISEEEPQASPSDKLQRALHEAREAYCMGPEGFDRALEIVQQIIGTYKREALQQQKAILSRAESARRDRLDAVTHALQIQAAIFERRSRPDLAVPPLLEIYTELNAGYFIVDNASVNQANSLQQAGDPSYRALLQVYADKILRDGRWNDYSIRRYLDDDNDYSSDEVRSGFEFIAERPGAVPRNGFLGLNSEKFNALIARLEQDLWSRILEDREKSRSLSANPDRSYSMAGIFSFVAALWLSSAGSILFAMTHLMNWQTDPPGGEKGSNNPRMDVQTASVLVPPMLEAKIGRLAALTNGRTAIIGVRSGTVYITDLRQVKELAKIKVSLGASDIAISEDGNWVACAVGFSVHLWEMRSDDKPPVEDEILMPLETHWGRIAISRDGGTIVAAAADPPDEEQSIPSIAVIQNRRVSAIIYGKKKEQIRLSGDGRRLFTIADNGKVSLWDIPAPEEHYRKAPVVIKDLANSFYPGSGREPGPRLLDMATDEAGDRLITLSDDSTIHLYDTGKAHDKSNPHASLLGPEISYRGPLDERPVAVGLSPDGRTAATGYYNGVIKIWSLDRRTQEITLGYEKPEQSGHSIQSVIISKENMVIASNSAGHFGWTIPSTIQEFLKLYEDGLTDKELLERYGYLEALQNVEDMTAWLRKAEKSNPIVRIGNRWKITGLAREFPFSTDSKTWGEEGAELESLGHQSGGDAVGRRVQLYIRMISKKMGITEEEVWNALGQRPGRSGSDLRTTVSRWVNEGVEPRASMIERISRGIGIEVQRLRLNESRWDLEPGVYAQVHAAKEPEQIDLRFQLLRELAGRTFPSLSQDLKNMGILLGTQPLEKIERGIIHTFKEASVWSALATALGEGFYRLMTGTDDRSEAFALRTWGARIQLGQLLKGWTNQQLAEAIGVSAAIITEWIMDEGRPNDDHQKALAQPSVLNIPIGELFGPIIENPIGAFKRYSKGSRSSQIQKRDA